MPMTVCDQKLSESIKRCSDKTREIKENKRRIKVIEEETLVYTPKPVRTVKIQNENKFDLSKYEKFKGNPKYRQNMPGFF